MAHLLFRINLNYYLMKIKNMLFYKSAPNFGLLILRIGIGIMFMMHGYPKITGGAPVWEFLGSQMSHIGIGFAPVFWGFLAAMAEFAGGFFLIIGLLTRPAAFTLFFTMLIATIMHLSMGDGIKGSAHSIELGIVFLMFIIAGAGRFSLDAVLFRKMKSDS